MSPEMKPSDINALRKAPPLFWAVCVGLTVGLLFILLYYNAGWENTVSFFGGLWDRQGMWLPFISWFVAFFVAGLTVAVSLEKRLDKVAQNGILNYAIAGFFVKRLVMALSIISLMLALIVTRLIYTGYEWAIMLVSIALYAVAFYRKRAQI